MDNMDVQQEINEKLLKKEREWEKWLFGEENDKDKGKKLLP